MGVGLKARSMTRASVRPADIAPQVTGDRLRIGTWNIASNKNLDAIVSRIARLDVDICAVQEVLLDCTGDLPAVFAAGIGALHGYCWYFAPALSPDDLAGGGCEYYGLAILSRIPLRRIASFQLGPQSTGRIASAEAEPRILQVAVPQLDRPLIVGNTHLATTDDWSLSPTRRSQATRIAEIVRSIAAPGPLILSGDFNTGPSSSDLTELRQVLPHAYASKEGTFIGEPDRPPIDFFCSAAALAMGVSVFTAEGLSDHNIVVATLRDTAV
jgi:endonuclease/exonuclease/phosphatase family metal-dependent hydrolase